MNGRALILQAAQRAAKKRKTSHTASEGSDHPTLQSAEPHVSDPTARNEQQIAQSAIFAGTKTRASGVQQDADATAASDTVQLAGQLIAQAKTNRVPSAPGRGEVLSNAATDALIDGLEPHDQPLVAYINRSSVPRILRQVTTGPMCAQPVVCMLCLEHFCRPVLAHGKLMTGLQGVAKRLAGQQLARLLQDAGIPVSPSAARSLEAATLRKLAGQAALAQEMCIYRKGVGKQVCSHLMMPFCSSHLYGWDVCVIACIDSPATFLRESLSESCNVIRYT